MGNCSFLERPSLNYSLGGVGAFGEIPIANNIIKAIVEEQIRQIKISSNRTQTFHGNFFSFRIRARFVWPNRLRLYLPIDEVRLLPDKSFLLIRPSGVLEVRVSEARDLLRMDVGGITGKGKSDPYAVVTVGSEKVML